MNVIQIPFFKEKKFFVFLVTVFLLTNVRYLSFVGKNSESRSSISVESIDSRASPNLEQRRSKSILKKSEMAHQRSTDPETEKLISDSTSAASVSLSNGGKDAGSGSECSPNKLPLSASKSVSPPRTPALSSKHQHHHHHHQVNKSQVILKYLKMLIFFLIADFLRSERNRAQIRHKTARTPD